MRMRELEVLEKIASARHLKVVLGEGLNESVDLFRRSIALTSR